MLPVVRGWGGGAGGVESGGRRWWSRATAGWHCCVEGFVRLLAKTVGPLAATVWPGRGEGATGVPSEGVTSTDTTSPGSPLPARLRSKVSLRLALAAVVLRVTPLTFQT